MNGASDEAIRAAAGAHVVDRVLARHLPAALAALPAWARAEAENWRDVIRAAALAWETRVSEDGRSDIDSSDMAPQWTAEIGTREAADLLGVSERQARRLAAAGAGRKVGWAWVLDRHSVLFERERRAMEGQ